MTSLHDSVLEGSMNSRNRSKRPSSSTMPAGVIRASRTRVLGELHHEYFWAPLTTSLNIC
jgi:hypothetical protein